MKRFLAAVSLSILLGGAMNAVQAKNDHSLFKKIEPCVSSLFAIHRGKDRFSDYFQCGQSDEDKDKCFKEISFRGVIEGEPVFFKTVEGISDPVALYPLRPETNGKPYRATNTYAEKSAKLRITEALLHLPADFNQDIRGRVAPNRELYSRAMQACSSFFNGDAPKQAQVLNKSMEEALAIKAADSYRQPASPSAPGIGMVVVDQFHGPKAVERNQPIESKQPSPHSAGANKTR